MAHVVTIPFSVWSQSSEDVQSLLGCQEWFLVAFVFVEHFLIDSIVHVHFDPNQGFNMLESQTLEFQENVELKLGWNPNEQETKRDEAVQAQENLMCACNI